MQLELWGLDYFDLFLVHFPIALAYVDPKHRYPPEWWGDDGKSVSLQNTPFQETWAAMEELVDEGLAKNIGVSNVAGALLVDILSYARIEPQVLQVELHPYLTQEPLLRVTKTLSIAVTAYSSFGPQSYLELGFKGNVKPLFQQDPVVKAAWAHDKKPAQVLLRWATQRGIAVIPKTNDAERLLSNLDCASFNLTEAEIEAISALNINLRLNNPADIDPRLAIFA
jgi:D-xylose reductase